jgi:hypothetical protein
MRVALILLLLVLPLGGCITDRVTNPPRTATEQLLVSSAADRAADQLRVMLPRGTRIFIDVHNFTGANGDDAKYAAASIEDRLLLQGLAVMADPKQADVIVALRAGALATNSHKVLIGIPSLPIPIPFAAGTVLQTPEFAFFSWDAQKGIAKFAATSYGAHDGALRSSTGSVIGVAKHNRKIILFIFGSTRNNLEPPVVNRLAQ